MIASAAKPLRALAGLMMIYGVSRIAIASYDFLPTHQAAVTPSVAETAGPDLATQRGKTAGVRAGHRDDGIAVRLAEDFRTSLAQVDALHTRVGYRSTRSAGAAPAQHNRIVSPLREHAITAGGPQLTGSATVMPDPQRAIPAAPLRAAELPPGAPAPTRESRGNGGLSGSVWALVRSGGSARDLAGAGSLGGSQVGARLVLPVAASPAFVTARASAALAQRDREAALGVGLHGRTAGIILEQRFAIDGTRRSETAVVGYGGFSEVALPGKLRLDGYGQAGIVGVKRQAAFVDGALRVERPLIQGTGGARLSGGAGIWGGAQPGASRLDIGPQLVARIPADRASARLALEYRVKIAGDARPTDGVALTLGADF